MNISNCHTMGATLITVGLSATVRVSPQSRQNGGFFKISSGSGTLSIVQGASNIYSDGYPIGASEVIQYMGPAVFFLAAAGATMTIALVASYSDSGMTLTP